MNPPALLPPRITLLAVFCFFTAATARAVINDTNAQYVQHYGKATHSVDVASSSGLIYRKGPYGVIVVFDGERSIGEAINKSSDMSPAEIANFLRINGAGVPWKKENITKSKGDEEKMRAQGVFDVQMWSRTDGKLFASYLHGMGGGVELHTLLIGNKKGVQAVSALGQGKKPLQPKPLP